MRVSPSSFWPGTEPKNFHKIMKVPVSMLRRLGIRVIIYLDDLLIMAYNIGVLIAARDTAIFLFRHLGLTMNHQKSEFNPARLMEFWSDGKQPNHDTVLAKRKSLKLKRLCQNILILNQVTLHELSSLTGKQRGDGPPQLVWGQVKKSCYDLCFRHRINHCTPYCIRFKQYNK